MRHHLTHYLLMLTGEGVRSIKLGTAAPVVKSLAEAWLHVGANTVYPLKQTTQPEPSLEIQIFQDGRTDMRIPTGTHARLRGST